MRSLVVLILGALACAPIARGAAGAKPGDPVPAGVLTERPVNVSVFLRSDTPAAQADARLAALAHERFPDIALVKGPGEKGPATNGPAGYGVVLAPEKQPLPPDDAFAYAARRLSPDERAQVKRAKSVQVLQFVIDPARRADLAAVCALAHALAQATNAVLEDGQTRELFTVDQWKAARLDSWQGAIAAVPGHIAVRPWQNAAGTGVATAGMARFGLPDLEVSGLAAKDVPVAAAVIVLAAQQLVERPQLDRAGVLAIHATALLHAAMRAKPAAGASGNADLPVVVAAPSADSGARRIAISPAGAPPADLLARALREMTGHADETALSAEDDAALTAASQRAQPRIAELRKIYRANPPADAELFVKAPFASADGGREWMWVQVVKWEEGKLTGTLLNAPADVPGVKEGQSVTVPDGELYDYRYEAKGKEPEGGETDRLIEKR